MHGIKDYLDMLTILKQYPNIHQTFNLVPSLLEQIESYVANECNDRFLDLSYKKVEKLRINEKQFILENFFMANEQNIIFIYPRYKELFLKKKNKEEFSKQDYLDLQVWFNLAWIDPHFLEEDKVLNALVKKGKLYNHDNKVTVLEKQKSILKQIIPTYKKYQEEGQIEISTTPFYHPILPLIYNSEVAKEINKKIDMPKENYRYEEDCVWHIKEAIKYYRHMFGVRPQGMWPSEQAISSDTLPILIKQRISWIVADEGILFQTLKKPRNGKDLYRAYSLDDKSGELTIVFRDRYLSDLIGFTYHNHDTDKAVSDFMQHLKNINNFFKNKDSLVVIAMDGENAWEYYKNDGRDFLNLLYKRISEAKDVQAVTVKEYLNLNKQRCRIKKIRPGSWINSDFTKWIGGKAKNRAWQLINGARKILEEKKAKLPKDKLAIIYKQIYILEGSDWFWWYGERQKDFDYLFRLHLKNFYSLIEETPKQNLDIPLE